MKWRRVPTEDFDGKIGWWVFLRIYAIMRFPEDIRSQNVFYKTMELDRSPGFRSEFMNNLPAADIIRKGPSDFFKTFLYSKNSDTAYNGGLIAGHVFLFLLSMLKHRPEQASIAKAQFLTWKLFGESPSQRTIKQYWSDFRTVAHFHLAFHLWPKSLRDPTTVDEAQFKGAVNSFLLSSQFLLWKAVQMDEVRFDNCWSLTDPKQKPNPLLDDAAYGEVLELTEYMIPDLGPTHIEALKLYRAPTHAK